jgi:LmbE family N-acetylglucosaminyl deacetylase
MKDILSYNKYLILLPHADDEVYCSTLIKRLLDQKKELSIILVTNGDAGVNPELRKEEMAQSIKELGYPYELFLQLNVSEKDLMSKYSEVFSKLKTIVNEKKPECVISVDYEGGHEGHDSINFILHTAAQDVSATHIVYPAYHYKDMHREGLYFLPGRHPDFTLKMDESEVDLKIKLLEAHKGQIGFFLRVQKYQDTYFSLLFDREVYRVMPEEFDYFQRPHSQLGYEYHRNGFKFEDFVSSAQSLLQEINKV